MAHTYSTDSAERRLIPFFIAAAAIGSAFLVSHLFYKYQIAFPWWASPPIDTMAFYGFYYWLFDRYIWKLPVTRWLRITRIPDLSGVWHGHVHPTETNGVSAGLGTVTEVAISIQQTWTELLILGRTKLSRSHSLSGSVIVRDECSVSYEYVNEPLAPASSTMHAHRGMARLTINDVDGILEGDYYSGRDRQNIGTIRLTRTNVKNRA
jgi:SMODS-associating 2TM, beta-strand rich effector domain